jgi:hypothetical protein
MYLQKEKDNKIFMSSLLIYFHHRWAEWLRKLILSSITVSGVGRVTILYCYRRQKVFFSQSLFVINQPVKGVDGDTRKGNCKAACILGEDVK